MEKPTINYAIATQKFRAKLSDEIVSLQKTIPIPTYMVEGIIASILADIRSALIAENTMEHVAFSEENTKYYEEQLEKLNEEILKLKAEKEEKP
ncbi:toxin [Gardnerella vaginalis]|uniref:Toxin n=1 Tax=Gardnerella vaginalis TaxID=2702 RepID=A0ABD4ZBK7_GARVA|nr:toxin [Gardnerella vaginalis]MDK6696045.1 toxin [Gardnerella vaginalis]PKY96595.1 toxin [Gardnerella vaginalis]RFT36053.1 toxin [Bifidobacteriaceae bacterium NR020]